MGSKYIKSEILARTGVDLPLVVDSEAPKTEYEIVVGETAREISARLNADTEKTQFAILADHIANLDDEVKKDELDMIIMAVQNFEEFDGSEVMGRLMQERMGLHLYDVDDVLFAVREEHHVTMFQALAMVAVSDFNLTKEKKNILNVLSKAWSLRADKCNEFLGDLIEQVNEAYPGKLVIE